MSSPALPEDALPALPALHPLVGAQLRAVAPTDSVWLSASAGTGKTQVLSSRVLRLLLQPDVRPEQILCLTFTKAGAAEMAERINSTLARWVRHSDSALFAELQAIGADTSQEQRQYARTLFAAVLDCPGGGLRIDTIHAFSQWLLAAFPEEAGLTAGTRPMEEREKLLLSRQVLADLLLDAEAGENHTLLDTLARLALRMGEGQVQAWLMAVAAARDVWFAGDWQQGALTLPVHRLLGLAGDASETTLVALCTDEAFAMDALLRCRDAYRQWGTATADKALAAIGIWLEGDARTRLAGLDKLAAIFLTQKGDVRVTDSKALNRIDPEAPAALRRLRDTVITIREQYTLIKLAEWLVPALELGRAFAHAWDAAKVREGLIDFDDQIARAAALLGGAEVGGSGMAEWIRYKLDRRFDHILVDEAQDTNAAQWRIIDALTGDFFAGEGQRGRRIRTLFVVGDYKQAIFGFQGTSPENFEAARKQVKARIQGAAANARTFHEVPSVGDLAELGLDHSFRTAAPVLDFVDRAMTHIGAGAFGLKDTGLKPHQGEDRPGLVALWRPVLSRMDGGADDHDEAANDDGATDITDAADTADSDDRQGTENWLSRPDRILADRIARQVKAWIDDGFPLAKGVAKGAPPRRATAGDVMVLVRKRRALAGLIVARLHAAGVPVAGVDRLRLGAPLAVRDLVAALRFAVQPFDDLNLACLLVSPLVGWTQEQLLEHGWRPVEERRKGLRLWEHLRGASHPDVAAALGKLGTLLARADYEPVSSLLHWLLVGPWQARAALVARLGHEANDPMDELVNAAHAYMASATPSLAGFLAWFDAGDGELKRDAGGGHGLVRVMTVHGAKGLQAPIVILADATGDPEKNRSRGLMLADPASMLGGGEPRHVLMPPDLRKGERVGRLEEAAASAQRAEMEEHWRLLYVAMTRAEEALFVAGALGARKTKPPRESWYQRLAELWDGGESGGDGAWIADPIWGARLEHGALAPSCAAPVQSFESDAPMMAARAEHPLPAWLHRPAPEEPRPPNPLVPSALGEDNAPALPLAASPSLRAAARRGTLIHRLLERLPDIAPAEREARAHTWLTRQAGELDSAARQEIATAALKLVTDPRWQDMFSQQALAEAHVAALVGDQVISGMIDRLLIEPHRIRIIDFKTTRRPPAGIETVPVAVMRQMAAYCAALEVTYPGRQVEAAVLYTETPVLIALPEDRLAEYKRDLGVV